MNPLKNLHVIAFCRGLVLNTSVCPRVLYAAFSTITDSGLGRIGLEAPDLISLQVEADAARRNRYRYGLVPKPMEMETEEYECSDRAVRAAGVVEIFRRTAMSLLDEDARQVKSCDKAADALSGMGSAYSFFFKSWTSGMRDGLANEARSRPRSTIRRS